MAFIEVSDFQGKFKIPQDEQNIIVTQSYIYRYVPIYGAKIFGAAMWQEIVADMGSGDSPADPILEAIFIPFQEDTYCGVSISTGAKNAIIGFIYFHRNCDQVQRPSQISGLSRPKAETAETSASIPVQAYDRYNESVETVRAIQAYARTKYNDYPDFKGEYFRMEYHF